MQNLATSEQSIYLVRLEYRGRNYGVLRMTTRRGAPGILSLSAAAVRVLRHAAPRIMPATIRTTEPLMNAPHSRLKTEVFGTTETKKND